MTNPTWRRSTRCGTGACVEVAAGPVVLVRDAKLPVTAPVLVFDRPVWAAFTAALRAGTVGTR